MTMSCVFVETQVHSPFMIKYGSFDFDFVLQQHLLCGVSGWRGERAGRLSQPA